jgi:hypothetical protein
VEASQTSRPAGFQHPYRMGDPLELHLAQLHEGHPLGRRRRDHLLAHQDLRRYVPHEQAESIRRDYGYLLGDFRRPRSIYTELRTIINGQRTARQLTAYLDDTAWDDLEDVLAEVLRTCPPIFFYLDAVDEEFSHAPMYWLRCQKGLFYQVMRFLRDPRLGGRLHIVISIRDIVMSSVYRSEPGATW